MWKLSVPINFFFLIFAFFFTPECIFHADSKHDNKKYEIRLLESLNIHLSVESLSIFIRYVPIGFNRL